MGNGVQGEVGQKESVCCRLAGGVTSCMITPNMQRKEAHKLETP